MLILTYGDTLTHSSVFSVLDPVTQTKPPLEDFWNIGIVDKIVKGDDQTAMENFKETVEFKDGRYQVK